MTPANWMAAAKELLAGKDLGISAAITGADPLVVTIIVLDRVAALDGKIAEGLPGQAKAHTQPISILRAGTTDGAGIIGSVFERTCFVEALHAADITLTDPKALDNAVLHIRVFHGQYAVLLSAEILSTGGELILTAAAGFHGASSHLGLGQRDCRTAVAKAFVAALLFIKALDNEEADPTPDILILFLSSHDDSSFPKCVMFFSRRVALLLPVFLLPCRGI